MIHALIWTLLAALCLSTFCQPAPPPFDLVILDGVVVDGSGSPGFPADLAIHGDTIARIGELSEVERGRAGQVIDARGLIVAPGFIDIHSHSDFTLLVDGTAQSKIRQGVTTEILGESGSDGTAVRPDGLLGQGKPHPRWYGTFPRILGKYVRQEKVLPLEEAVRKMTSLNATKLGISDRGTLKQGMKADVTVFDPQRVIDKATFEDPHQYSEGIEYVVVNGVPVLEGNRHLGTRPGRILRKAREE